MLSENGKIPGSRPIAARKAEIGASEVTGYAQAVSITPPVRADLIKGGKFSQRGTTKQRGL